MRVLLPLFEKYAAGVCANSLTFSGSKISTGTKGCQSCRGVAIRLRFYQSIYHPQGEAIERSPHHCTRR